MLNWDLVKFEDPKAEIETIRERMRVRQKIAGVDSRFLPKLIRYSEDQPRDEDGKWTSGGGGGVQPTESINTPALNAKAINVGGDEWNKQTAVRLETQYQSVKPLLEKIVAGSSGKEVEEASEHHDEDVPYVPDEWDGLSGDQQKDAKQAYIAHNKDSYIESEVSNWHESGAALGEAKTALAYAFSGNQASHDGKAWADEALEEFFNDRSEREKPIPYTKDQILEALTIDYEDYNSDGGNKRLDIDFDDEHLKEPVGYDPSQATLPGIEPIDPAGALTPDMRKEIVDVIEAAFDKQADHDESNLDPPEYLGESAVEYLEENWDHSLDETSKFNFVKNNMDIISDAEAQAEHYTKGSGGGITGKVAIPNLFDPLQSTGGEDYKRTQRLANYLSLERQHQLMAERDIVENPNKGEIKRIDDKLWSDWKGSSTNMGGSVLQLATSEELGGRYRNLSTPRAELIEYANRTYKGIGGFAGVKALVRAKWETTQYLLDKAGCQTLEVYRGLKVDLGEEKTETVEVPNEQHPEDKDWTQTFEKVADVKVVRNGAMSTTVDRNVANGWSGGSGDKIVLRIDTPRTSVLSVPAYGINVHSEREVVVAGTAWKGWDAWANNAPSFDQYPMKEAA